MIRFLQSGNKAAKYILVGFLTILAVSMVAYLIPGFTGADVTNQNGTLATVAGEPIRRDQVAKLVQAQMTQARASGQQIPDFYVPILTQRAVQELIQQQEVAYEAGRLGLTVSDEELRDELRKGVYKEIFYPQGQFIGKDKYLQLFAENGTTAAEFESSMRKDLLRRKLFYTIVAGVTVSPTDVEKMYKDKNTKVKFQYAVLNMEDIQKQIKPSDSELKAFYDANLDRYKDSIREKRQIRYFVLEDKDAEAKAAVTPEEVQRYYSQNQQEFRAPERVKVRHILVSAGKPGEKPDQAAIDAARAKAADILKQIKAGGDFAELAKKYSQDPGSAAQGGELGWQDNPAAFVPGFSKVAFSQNAGQISDPVQTEFGFHIIQTEDKKPAGVKPFAEVKDQIERNLKSANVNKILNSSVNGALDEAQKQGLEKAAADNKAQVVQSNPIAQSDSLPGIGPSPQLMSSVFTTKEKSVAVGRYTQGYVIFEVTKIEPPRTPSFDEIKDRVAGDFKNQRANELLQKKAREMSDRAHAEHDLAKAAKEAGATVKTGDLVGRTSQVADLGSMNGPLSAAFDLKQGEISGPLMVGAKGVVLQINERQEPSTSDPGFIAERDTLRDQLVEQKRNQALQLFMGDLNQRLEKEGKLKINKNEMNNLAKSRS
jgi:peptidyl-prolyl cis-trans isomerase D